MASWKTTVYRGMEWRTVRVWLIRFQRENQRLCHELGWGRPCDILLRNPSLFCSCPKNLSKVKFKDDELICLVEERCVGKVKFQRGKMQKQKNLQTSITAKEILEKPSTWHWDNREVCSWWEHRSLYSCRLRSWANLKLAMLSHDAGLEGMEDAKLRRSWRSAEARHRVAELQTLKRGPDMLLCEDDT